MTRFIAQAVRERREGGICALRNTKPLQQCPGKGVQPRARWGNPIDTACRKIMPRDSSCSSSFLLHKHSLDPPGNVFCSFVFFKQAVFFQEHTHQSAVEEQNVDAYVGTSNTSDISTCARILKVSKTGVNAIQVRKVAFL